MQMEIYSGRTCRSFELHILDTQSFPGDEWYKRNLVGNYLLHHIDKRGNSVYRRLFKSTEYLISKTHDNFWVVRQIKFLPTRLKWVYIKIRSNLDFIN